MKKMMSLFLCFLILFSTIIYADDMEEEDINQEEIKQEIVTASVEASKEPVINSRAAIVLDRKTKVPLYEKKSNEKRPMASTTKIMTSIVALEKADLNQVVEVSKKAAGTGGSRLGLKAGDKITMNDLLYGLMLRSGNDAAIQIAETVGGSKEGFAELMNQKAKELGLTSTHFVTPHGLDETEHYTTAYELACLTDYALNNEKFVQIVGSKTHTIMINNSPRELFNTNELLGNLAGVDGVKTGFTNGAGRCLVTSTTREGNQIITVVLGADTKKIRTKDSATLIEYAFSSFERIHIKQKINEEFEKWKQTEESHIPIIKGEQGSPELVLGDIPYEMYPVAKEKVKNINIKIKTVNQLKPPVDQNQILGILEVKQGEDTLFSVNILAKQDVGKKNIVDYYLQILKAFPI